MSKPTRACCAATRLRVNSAATMSSIAVTAIWPATSTSRTVQRHQRNRRDNTASPRRSAVRFGLDVLRAGARPARMPAASVTAVVKSSTRPSMRRSNAIGNGSGRLTELTIRVIHQATTIPTTAPIADNTTLSVTN